MKFKQKSIWFLSIFFIASTSFAFQIDLELDLQYKNSNFKTDNFTVEKTGFSFREILKDDMGDRLLFFGRLESENNFSNSIIDQAYIQYKGPMGRWNTAIGRFILPFGLLANYDSEWFLIKTPEYRTIGIKQDSGLKFFGVISDFEYVISVTQGLDFDKWVDIDNDKLLIIRAGYQGVDFEDLRIGFSVLSGSILRSGDTAYKKLLCFDLTKYFELFVLRAEITVGNENEKPLFSTFFGTDYSLFPLLDLNIAHSYFKIDSALNIITIGITYNTPIFGLSIRAANKVSIGDKNGNEIFIQIYKLFSYFL